MPDTKTNERLATGQSNSCARFHHERCTTPETCVCACHTETEQQQRSRRSAGARRAWQSRREQQSQASTSETPPKRPEIKPAVKAAVPAAAARQIKSEFAVLLWGVDQAAAKFVPKYWTPPEDQLTAEERTALVHATYNELEARFPKLLKYLAKAQESATEAVLIYTIAMIAAPRLARHGVIPPELASAIVFAPIVLANLQQAVAPAEPEPAAVGAEPAHVGGGPDGNGQIDLGEPLAPGPQIQIDPAQQTGFSDLRHRPGDPPGTVNGRYPL